MRLLCDQNVAQKYVDACIAAPDFQAVTVRDALDPRASDLDIAVYAKTNEYIVFPGDDFFNSPISAAVFISISLSIHPLVTSSLRYGGSVMPIRI